MQFYLRVVELRAFYPVEETGILAIERTLSMNKNLDAGDFMLILLAIVAMLIVIMVVTELFIL